MVSVIIEAQAVTPTVAVLKAEGIINPVLADYIKRGIEQAEEDDEANRYAHASHNGAE